MARLNGFVKCPIPTASNQHQELREKVRARAEACRMVGLTEWDNLPSRTREAFYGIAAELDAVDGLFEQVQSLEREADNLTERLEKRLDEDSVYRVYDEQVEENQRLKEQLEAAQKVIDAARELVGDDARLGAGFLCDCGTEVYDGPKRAEALRAALAGSFPARERGEDPGEDIREPDPPGLREEQRRIMEAQGYEMPDWKPDVPSPAREPKEDA